jgi:hypothetical protein
MSPHLALEYIIRICLSHQVLDRLSDNAHSTPKDHREFANFAEIMRLTATTDVAGRIVSAIAVVSSKDGPRFGIIPLYNKRAAQPRALVKQMYGLSLKSPAFPATEPENSLMRSFHGKIRSALRDIPPNAYTGTWFNAVDSLATFRRKNREPVPFD